MNKGFTVIFLETTKENEMSKIKNGYDLILSKGKETLNIIFYDDYKWSSQNAAHRLLNTSEVLSEGQWSQNYFPNNIKISSAFFCVVIYTEDVNTS